MALDNRPNSQYLKTKPVNNFLLGCLLFAATYIGITGHDGDEGHGYYSIKVKASKSLNLLPQA